MRHEFLHRAAARSYFKLAGLFLHRGAQRRPGRSSCCAEATGDDPMTSNISRLPIRAGARPESGSLRTRALAAAEVAAKFADAVDRDGRFPKEAFDAIRDEKLLGILIPATLGGEDASPAQ